MATTYTPKLNLPKPSDGDYDWLTPQNQAMDLLDSYVGQLLDERAVSGTATGGSATTLIDSGQSWGVDTFVDAIVVVQRNGKLLRAERVTSNTADTLTFASGSVVQSGDAYSIFPQSALQTLTNVLANGAQGNIPAGQQFALRDSTGTTTYFSVDEATGAVTLGVDPTAPLNAVTKQYADNNFLALAGGQMTGLFRNRVLTSIASAATLDLSSATGANANLLAQITGTASISAVTMDAGSIVEAIAGGAFTLVNGANLVVEGGANYTCAVGDRLTFISFDGTTVYVFIKRVDGQPVMPTRRKIGLFTRDISLASGTQQITGIGFTPRIVRFKAVVPSKPYTSDGWDDGTVANCRLLAYNGVWSYLSNYSIFLMHGAADNYTGRIQSMDADGFTIAWTKTGAPSGTARILYEAEE